MNRLLFLMCVLILPLSACVKENFPDRMMEDIEGEYALVGSCVLDFKGHDIICPEDLPLISRATVSKEGNRWYLTCTLPHADRSEEGEVSQVRYYKIKVEMAWSVATNRFIVHFPEDSVMEDMKANRDEMIFLYDRKEHRVKYYYVGYIKAIWEKQ